MTRSRAQHAVGPPTSKGDEDADEASGSEPEEDATPAEAAADDDDRLFRKASGQRNPAPHPPLPLTRSMWRM